MLYLAFKNFPTVFKEISEELGDTFMTVILFTRCSVAVSLNFGGIKKIHHLIRGKGSLKRQTSISVVFGVEETSIVFFRMIKSICSFGAFLRSY